MSEPRIEIKVKELAERRGIDKPAHLAKAAGITKPAAARFWKATLSCVDLPNLAKVCIALECDVAAVLVLTPPIRAKAAQPKKTAPKK